MKRLFVMIALFLGCASQMTMDEAPHSKNTFFAASVKEGMEVLTLYKYQLVKIDTIMQHHNKTYVFHYKQ